MTEVISVKFKNRGKNYYFAPNGLEIRSGDRVIVETAKGLEIADCSRQNHMVEDTAVIQPLRPVVRIATAEDLKAEQSNKKREAEALLICRDKIAEHGLDMKLVDVECSFDGSKTLFFFTSEGRVDFRELVKDLAGIFRNRIELRQIGVRDEAKMLGGIGICGRPYCCNQFLDDFQPVSTKMAKIQSLSLNPAKISGSCGRLMCCLRYEEEAYESLVKKVPKQGAFVETPDGYGTAVTIDLLHQLVKVKLDGQSDDLHVYKAKAVASVPGGRPKDGEEPAHVLSYNPDEDEIEEDTAVEEKNSAAWDAGLGYSTSEFASAAEDEGKSEPQEKETQEDGRENEKPAGGSRRHRSRRGGRGDRDKSEKKPDHETKESMGKITQAEPRTVKVKPVREHSKKGESRTSGGKTDNAADTNIKVSEKTAEKTGEKKNTGRNRHRRYYHAKPKSGQNSGKQG